ncbi:glycoside hydrolase family 2 protein [Burkholderia stagnalis]|uniref:Glycoside hydrolase family 2 protein n=2 Tax=Burkholderia stagnalis TaxID=1503054 RepID=A0ABX9YNX6_9BURK|nr:glycoside hydrolase family 2 protein [Burkholderia stagnalis]RQQ57708.1 glycoside hydrolase family 2 protein [Burkholderia stagnalis]RQQ67492.1 glycoside hydrolase family 2 protein [Burkholderia stagnalis]RQQ69087.1 glycoside hydrolase family 2 protein [Burkholderia stagnalis]RQQ79580.1 glycoside hydrolase family 2 protein [Burkholderia stagnalis]RQQ88809.1 glycoside hydrolase family 2 protein [Burkholderia stagnalis]
MSRAMDTAAWSLRATPAGAARTPADLGAAGDWIAAPVPGTVAQALAQAGRLDTAGALAERDYWYRTTLHGHGPRVLRFHGLATVAEAWLDETPLLRSDSMFVSHDVAVALDGSHRLTLCFRALGPHLRDLRTPQRARWRTRLAEPAALRAVRTSLFGHMPGWFPPHPPIGPWRPVDVLDPAAGPVIARCDLFASIDGETGRLDAELAFSSPLPDALVARLSCGEHHATLERAGADRLRASVTLPRVRRWWPHTHGEPALHDIALHLDGARRALGATGFRTIEPEPGDDGLGFGLRVNGVPVFARGACWSSAAPLALHADDATYRHLLEQARDAGFNMIRVGGTMTYEADAFHAWCDRLGLLVWQDFMFANFDYALAAPSFDDAIRREAEQFLTRRRASPSLAVLCGGSEIAQQAAMSGLAPKQRFVALTAEQLASHAAALRPDVPYLPDTPDGGVLPFAPRERVSHYYGVGAYLRPLDDARRADVRFASECLAFANLPCDAALDELGRPGTHEPCWKQGVPRDPGASWDFDDVRDHYLHALYAVEPGRLRRENPARYVELSRAVLADVMRDTFSEWRRAGSRCAGALVWQFQDVRPGAGWGIVDAAHRPKSVWHALRQVLQPVQILLVDEGLNGLDVHVINERPAPLSAAVELIALRDGRTPVARAGRAIRVAAHDALRLGSADLLGRFFDWTYAYRFGPCEHDAVVATLRGDDGAILSQAFHFPSRTHPAVFARRDLGLEACVSRTDGAWAVDIATRHLARHVQILAPGFVPRDDWFHVAPGMPARVALAPLDAAQCDADAHMPPPVEIRAVNSGPTIRATPAA